MRFIHFLTCLHSLIITFIHSLVFFKHCGKLSKTYRIRQSSCLTSHHCDQFVLLAPLLYSFARALVIRYHKLSKLSHKNVLSHCQRLKVQNHGVSRVHSFAGLPPSFRQPPAFLVFQKVVSLCLFESSSLSAWPSLRPNFPSLSDTGLIDQVSTKDLF